MRVCKDDAVGLLPAGIAHAECALVHMLELSESHQAEHVADSAASRRESQVREFEGAVRALLASAGDGRRP